MKAINNYLTEKLKINKDVIGKAKNHQINAGDAVFRIIIQIDNPCVIFPLPRKCASITNTTITLKLRNTDQKSEYFINSKGHMQSNKEETIVLYMTYEDGMDFLDNLKEKPEETIEKYLEYENLENLDFSKLLNYMKIKFNKDHNLNSIKRIYEDFMRSLRDLENYNKNHGKN